MAIEVQEDDTKKLYEASIRGCVATLYSLLERDPLLLDRISLAFFTETPLHISSLLGHLDFTIALLHHKPKLTAERNSQRQCPLHLASAEGYTEIVEALLSVNSDVCLVADQHGRIPLHLAVMRGRVEVTQQLITARPDSIRTKLEGGENVLHLFVRYNHLECLKLLVTSLEVDVELLNSADRDGNTILHLAAIMKQSDTIKYLISVPEVRVEANALTAIFEKHHISDFTIIPMRIQDGTAETTGKTKPTDQKAITVTPKQLQAKPSSGRWNRYLENKAIWLEKTRGNLMIVATVIAAMAFQAAMNPPSELWQSESQEKQCRAIIKDALKNISIAEARNVAVTCLREFKSQDFVICNTLSFSASLSIMLLLVLLPLQHKFSAWIMLIAMCITVVFVVVTYAISITLTKISKQEKTQEKFDNAVVFYYILFWVVLLVIVLLLLSLKLLFWILKKLVKFASNAYRMVKQPRRLKVVKQPAGMV